MSDSCDPMDCNWPGSSVCGIFPARILEWAAISYSRGSSQPRDQIWVSCTAGRFFTGWGSREAHVYICTCIYPPIYLYQYWCLFHTLDYGISRQFLYHERIRLPPREAKPNVILFILLLSSLLSGPQGWSGLEWTESPTPIWGRSQVKSFFSAFQAVVMEKMLSFVTVIYLFFLSCQGQERILLRFSWVLGHEDLGWFWLLKAMTAWDPH